MAQTNVSELKLPAPGVMTPTEPGLSAFCHVLPHDSLVCPLPKAPDLPSTVAQVSASPEMFDTSLENMSCIFQGFGSPRRDFELITVSNPVAAVAGVKSPVDNQLLVWNSGP